MPRVGERADRRAGDGGGGSVPPPENQTLFDGRRARVVSRATLTGCSCSSIWISFCQRRHVRGVGPCGQQRAQRAAGDDAERTRVDSAASARGADEAGVGPRRDEREPVGGEMRVERRDERVGVGAREIVDDARESHVVAPDHERHRIGGEPVRGCRVDAERGERGSARAASPSGASTP